MKAIKATKAKLQANMVDGDGGEGEVGGADKEHNSSHKNTMLRAKLVIDLPKLL